MIKKLVILVERRILAYKLRKYSAKFKKEEKRQARELYKIIQKLESSLKKEKVCILPGILPPEIKARLGLP